MKLKSSHEMFAQALIKNGGHQTEAYMEVYKSKRDTARHGGSYLMRNVEIRSRVVELLEAQGLGLLEVIKQLQALTQARKIIVVGGYSDSAPDNFVRLGAIKMALRLHGILGNKMDMLEVYLSPGELEQKLLNEENP